MKHTEMGLKIIITKKMRASPEYKNKRIGAKWTLIQTIRNYAIKHRILPSRLIEDWIASDNFYRGWEYGFAIDNCRQFRWYRFLSPKFRRKFKEIQERRLGLVSEILYNNIVEAFDKLKGTQEATI